MDCFDLKASSRPDITLEPPPGYEAGWARIGDLDETIFFSTEIWQPSDYSEHWKATAQLLLQGRTALFCTDLTDDSASIFIGFPAPTGFEFEQWLVPRRSLQVEGLLLKIADAERADNASCWHVSAEAVKAFAST